MVSRVLAGLAGDTDFAQPYSLLISPLVSPRVMVHNATRRHSNYIQSEVASDKFTIRSLLTNSQRQNDHHLRCLIASCISAGNLPLVHPDLRHEIFVARGASGTVHSATVSRRKIAIKQWYLSSNPHEVLNSGKVCTAEIVFLSHTEILTLEVSARSSYSSVTATPIDY
jgi:hypothetical protein